MKRISFVALVALSLTAAPVVGQQAQSTVSGSGQGTGQGGGTTAQGSAATTTQGRQAPLCRDAQGRTYSQGALVKGTAGELLRCESGAWEATPADAMAQSTTRQGSNIGMGNVRLELTITDQSGTGQPVKKAVTMLVAERGEGKVRSRGEVYRAGTSEAPGNQYIPVTLNADASIAVIEGDRIRIYITVEYEPATPGPAEARRPSGLNQTVTVILANGKPTTIVESSDPVSDRKVTLQATATILR